MNRSHLRRTPLSLRVSALRATLLLSLGLSPLACEDSDARPPDAAGGSSGQAGTPEGGALVQAGAPSDGGALVQAGAPSDGGAGGAAGLVPADYCPDPVFDPVTKLVICSNGRAHREQSRACTYSVPPTGEGGAGGASEGEGGAAGALPLFQECSSDTDCAAWPRGYCESNGGGEVRNFCRSGCVQDSDCGNGICGCDGVHPGRCLVATCSTDDDCGPNSLCAPVTGVCGPESFHCTTPEDQCISNEDCGPPSGICEMQDGHRACTQAVCGRPFMVAEAPRLAAIAARSDWLEPTLAPHFGELSPIERAQLAAHWARLGQMEHASIAAFARFNLQLLSLGAPADLVEACNRALADETAHARTCFALASAYGGAPVGPAPLDITHCFEDTNLVAIAKLVLREGCLGETVAALEASAVADAASDPAVKQAMTRIAADELQHAELAFRFLFWALTQSTAEERHELARAAAQQLAEFESEARTRDLALTDVRLAAHGLLEANALRAIQLAATRDIARPISAALFDVPAMNAA
jgi:hypothetical protein